MSVIRWEDPPGDNRGRSCGVLNHGAIAACLRRRPTAWALVAEGPDISTGISGQIRAGVVAAYRPAGSFEAVFRQVNGTTRLYARYVGDPSAVGGEPSGDSSKDSFDLGGVEDGESR